MHTSYTKRPTELIAVDPDGITYIIERRCKSLPCDDGEQAFFYCCLRDGQLVSWLGENHYQLTDGTALLAIACRLTDPGVIQR
ncbi:hypothetical protein D3C71_1757350 [compost metagenome]